MSNQVAGISCIIYVIVVIIILAIIILIIIIAVILAIAIVIDFVIFIVVTLCWLGGSWQPSTRPSSSLALSWFQNFVQCCTCCGEVSQQWRGVECTFDHGSACRSCTSGQ